MKKLLVVAMAAVVALAFVPGLVAEDAAKDVTVTGTVAVTKAEGAVSGVTVKADDGKVTTLKLDDNGKAVAKLDGKKAVVVGTLEGAVLVVKSSKEVVAEEKK